MRLTTTKLATVVAAGFLLGQIPNAVGDAWNKKTKLTVNETIEVPGAILQPGKYVVKLVDSQSNRHIVRFTNEDETQVLSTVIAIPNSRMKPTGKTEFGWYETPQGQPPAMRAWFYPGDTFGQEFVYPDRQGRELATRLGLDVPTEKYDQTEIAQAAPAEQTDRNQQAQRDLEAAQERERRQRELERSRIAQQQREQERLEEERRLMAQRQREQERLEQQPQVEQQRAQATSTSDELPETAGPAPLLALLGLASLGSAAVLRKLRKR